MVRGRSLKRKSAQKKRANEPPKTAKSAAPQSERGTKPFCAPRRCAVMRGQSELYLSVLGMQVYSFGLIPVIFLNTREKYSWSEKPHISAIS